MPERDGEAWNDEDVLTLRRMARAHQPVEDIARAVKRSILSVRTKARRLGLPAEVRGKGRRV